MDIFKFMDKHGWKIQIVLAIGAIIIGNILYGIN